MTRTKATARARSGTCPPAAPSFYCCAYQSFSLSTKCGRRLAFSPLGAWMQSVTIVTWKLAAALCAGKVMRRTGVQYALRDGMYMHSISNVQKRGVRPGFARLDFLFGLCELSPVGVARIDFLILFR